jgi:hypothetical protein
MSRKYRYSYHSNSGHHSTSDGYNDNSNDQDEYGNYSDGADDSFVAGTAGGFESSNFSSQGAINQAASYTAETNAAWSRYGAEVRGAGLYIDAHPQIIRRQAPTVTQAYTQNIKVRFLQPPPLSPPGVSYNLYIDTDQ